MTTTAPWPTGVLRAKTRAGLATIHVTRLDQYTFKGTCDGCGRSETGDEKPVFDWVDVHADRCRFVTPPTPDAATP